MRRRIPPSVTAVIFLALLAGSCSTTGRAPAASVPALAAAAQSGEPLVTSGTTFAGSQRVLARDNAGRLFIAYVKTVDGFDQLFVAMSADHGITWSDYPQISAGASTSSNPTLIMSPQGGLRVFWTRREVLTPAEEAQRSDEPTGVVGAGRIATAPGPSADTSPAAKRDDEDDQHRRQIFTSSFDGRKWSKQEQLTTGGYNGFPSGAWDAQGVLHLVWYGYDGAYYQVVTASLDRGAWSRPTLVSQGFPDSVNPTIVVDRNDDLHVAWYKFAPGTKDYQIFYRGFYASAGGWSEQIQLSAGLRTAMNVSLAVDSRGVVHAAYEGIPGPGIDTDVYVRSLRSGVWSAQEMAGTAAGELSQPTITTDGDGRAIVFAQSAADGRIHMMSSDDWSASLALPGEGIERFPSAAWALPGSGTSGDPQGASPVELVWTRMKARPANPHGENLVVYRTVTK